MGRPGRSSCPSCLLPRPMHPQVGSVARCGTRHPRRVSRRRHRTVSWTPWPAVCRPLYTCCGRHIPTRWRQCCTAASSLLCAGSQAVCRCGSSGADVRGGERGVEACKTSGEGGSRATREVAFATRYPPLCSLFLLVSGTLRASTAYHIHAFCCLRLLLLACLARCPAIGQAESGPNRRRASTTQPPAPPRLPRAPQTSFSSHITTCRCCTRAAAAAPYPPRIPRADAHRSPGSVSLSGRDGRVEDCQPHLPPPPPSFHCRIWPRRGVLSKSGSATTAAPGEPSVLLSGTTTARPC